MSTRQPLSFDQFAEHLGDVLDIEPDAFEPGARFTEDLGLDSFDVVEILVFVEDLGIHLPDHVVIGIETVGDLYDEYQARSQRAAVEQ